MEYSELRLLCDYLHTGAQAVNTWARPTPAAVNGELERDERAEIVYAEIWSPVTGPGVEEELDQIVIVVDGNELSPYISLSGIRGTVMAPPKDRMWQGRLYSFGTPRSSDALHSTTIKYNESLTVNTLVGATVAITQDYRVRLWGYVYKEAELPKVFGTMQFPTLLHSASGRSISLTKPAIPVNAATWRTLPGGKDQSIPKIMPFIRFARNLLATDGMQGDYQIRFSTGNVSRAEEDMYFDFDDKEALLVLSLGMKVAANMARTGLMIDGDYHPKGPTGRTSLFPTTVAINELNFGHLNPFAPVGHPYYAAIPLLARPYLIWNEIGYVVIRDDGVGAVAANAAMAAITGIRLEMRD